MPAKGFQMCLKRIVCPKEHGHPQTCLDGFGLGPQGLNRSAKSKAPLGWEFVVLRRNLAAEREAFAGWKPEDSKHWDQVHPENLLTPNALAAKLGLIKGSDGNWKPKKVPETVGPKSPRPSRLWWPHKPIR